MEAEDDKLVTVEDQKLINKFARLHQSTETLKAEMAALVASLENINEAIDEIMLLGEDDSATIPYQIGDSFIHMNNDDLNAQLEQDKTEFEIEYKKREASTQNLNAKKEELKTNLYNKFGDRINLETD